MKIGSLFTGVAGLDRAVVEVFGGEHAWFSEIDPAASKVLAYRFPGVPNLGDITKIDWSTVEPVDVLCGGWPCQPFSLAGKRKGIHDERALWPHVAGAVRALRPRFVVLENVSAVLTAGEFDRVAADLAACGYDLSWTCARASDVGAPHRRERLFVVAYPPDAKGDGRDEGRPESAGIVGGFDAAVSGDEPGVALLPTPPAQAAKHGAESRFGGGNGDVSNLWQIAHLLPTPRTSDTNGAGHHGDGGMDLRTTVTLLPTPNAQDGNGGGRYSSPGHQSTLPGEVRLLPTPLRSDAGPRGGTTGFGLRDETRKYINDSSAWGKYAPAIARWEQVTGQPAPPPTEPNKNGNPRLSAAFSEWLMGWPAGWVTDPAIGISRNDQLRCVGNGVVTLQAVAAIRYLLAVTA